MNNMKQSIYFLADGNCRQVMEFYHQVFGGDLIITTVGDSPAKDFMPPNFKEKIINARLRSEVVNISASDWLMPQQPRVLGNHLCFYLHGGTFEAMQSIFEQLAVGGTITDPLQDQFYGVYGALNDQFGNRWMFVIEKQN